MNKNVIVLAVLLSFLFFGCMSISVEQKVEKDGSSLVTQKLDMSYLVSYINSLQQTVSSGSLSGGATTIEPNTSFNLANYANYSTAASKGIIIEVTGDEEYAAGASYESADFYILNGNNYTLKNVIVSPIKSYAFVEKYYSSYSSNLGSLEPGDDDSNSVAFAVANVTPGTYPVVFLITFYDDKNVKQTVAHTAYFKVKEKQETIPSTASGLQNLTQTGKEGCINATKKDPNLTCNYSDDGILTLSKKITQEQGGYEFKKESRFPYIVYIFKADNLPQISQDAPFAASSNASALPALPTSYGMVSFMSGNSTKFTAPTAKQTAASAKLMNFKMTYTIEMPGELVTVKNGKIENNTAVYDVFELMDKGNTVEVESQELDVLMVGAVGFGVIVLLAVLVMAFFALTKRQ